MHIFEQLIYLYNKRERKSEWFLETSQKVVCCENRNATGDQWQSVKVNRF